MHNVEAIKGLNYAFLSGTLVVRDSLTSLVLASRLCDVRAYLSNVNDGIKNTDRHNERGPAKTSLNPLQQLLDAMPRHIK